MHEFHGISVYLFLICIHCMDMRVCAATNWEKRKIFHIYRNDVELLGKTWMNNMKCRLNNKRRKNCSQRCFAMLIHINDVWKQHTKKPLTFVHTSLLRCNDFHCVFLGEINKIHWIVVTVIILLYKLSNRLSSSHVLVLSALHPRKKRRENNVMFSFNT